MLVYMEQLNELTQNIRHTAKLNYKLLVVISQFLNFQLEIQFKDLKVETVGQIIKTLASITEIKHALRYTSFSTGYISQLKSYIAQVLQVIA